MKIKDFEKHIQDTIDKRLSIRINPNHDDIAGVYLDEVYLGVAVPPKVIKTQIDPNYTDIHGHAYRTKQQAEKAIWEKKAGMNQRKYDLLSGNDPDDGLII